MPKAANADKDRAIPSSIHKRKRKLDRPEDVPQVPGNGAADEDPTTTGAVPHKAKEAPLHQSSMSWKSQQQQGDQNQKKETPSPKVPKLKERCSDDRKKLRLALVELFAGLRTTHLAAKGLDSAKKSDVTRCREMRVR